MATLPKLAKLAKLKVTNFQRQSGTLELKGDLPLGRPDVGQELGLLGPTQSHLVVGCGGRGETATQNTVTFTSKVRAVGLLGSPSWSPAMLTLSLTKNLSTGCLKIFKRTP